MMHSTGAWATLDQASKRNDIELLKLFETLVHLSDYPKECVLRPYSEFCMEVFHARVNEYM